MTSPARHPHRILQQIHAWTGLVAGILIISIGLSGSALVFAAELDRMLHPELLRAQASGSPVSPNVAGDAIREQLSPDMQLNWLASPRTDQSVYRGWVGPVHDPFRVLYTVDPANGQILGVRAGDEDPIRWLRSLHIQFFLGPSGQILVGTIGVLTLILLLTGLILWWPRNRRQQRVAVTGMEILHRRIGILLLPLALPIIVSGILLAYPSAMDVTALRHLHDGSILGFPGRLVAALVGLLPLVLLITGMYMHLARRNR